MFRKTNNSVIGGYFHSVPKGDRRVCISGLLNGNIVTGLGYELIFGWDKPIKPADIANISQEPIWDGWDSEGGNLKVSPPHLYATGKDSAGYYAWMRYDNVQLNLSMFHQYELGKFIPPKKCPE